MKICVQGLWHLGSVTAACMASVNHNVVGMDSDKDLVEALQCGKAPIYEPGLNELILSGIRSKRLKFSSDRSESLANIELLWIAYDTPVDEDDNADIGYVLKEIEASIPHCPPNTLILISSQLPVGSTERLERSAKINNPGTNVSFAYSPENLRLGNALQVFLKPDRIVAGFRSNRDRCKLDKLFAPVSDRIEWMSVESAEITKHAINAFLATSVTFTNEIAQICEKIGANAKEVERGLKTEKRIGERAYVSPGSAFAGGTLARDINFLHQISVKCGLSNYLLSSIKPSNDYHKNWARRRLLARYKKLSDKTIGIWGLTYKPDTDTLRRSMAVELCNWLLENDVKVKVHDPVVNELPESWQGSVIKCKNPLEVLVSANALIVATEWSSYKEICLTEVSKISPGLMVLDANGFINGFRDIEGIEYFMVGNESGTGK